MSSDLPEIAAEDPVAVGIDRSAITDSVQQAFDPRPMVFGAASDGLPVAKIQGHLPVAPPLDPKTFVCMADASEFVIRRPGWNEVVARFKPEQVVQAESGDWYVTLEVALGSGASWRQIWRAFDIRTQRVRVEPLRPKCKHLAQQMVDFGQETAAVMVERLCTARRDENSFFMGLRDEQVHACEMRSPRDPASEERLRKFDETKLKLALERAAEIGDAFDVDSALDAEHARATEIGLTHANIFGVNEDEKGR